MKFSWIRVATMKNIIFILLTVAILSGCAAQSSLTPAMEADLTKPLYCNNPDECKVMWKRALQFVSRNAGYPIKSANAVLIETEGFRQRYLKGWREFNDEKAVSMRVTKVPRGNGRYQILTAAWCYKNISTRLNDLFISCIPDTKETQWRAKVFIREGRE